MACRSKSIRVTRAVHSDGTLNGHFLVFYRMDVSAWARARLSVLMEGSSGNLTCETVARYADDEAGFTSASMVDFPTNGSPTQITSDDLKVGSGYRDLDTTKLLAEFGLRVYNTTASKMNMAGCTLIIDLAE